MDTTLGDKMKNKKIIVGIFIGIIAVCLILAAYKYATKKPRIEIVNSIYAN